jgi:hypothetical protein
MIEIRAVDWLLVIALAFVNWGKDFLVNKDIVGQGQREFSFEVFILSGNFNLNTTIILFHSLILFES